MILLRLTLLLLTAVAAAEIPQPTDAPKALSPTDSARQFKLPDGTRIRLLAAEPLIHEPTGVCWDEKGRLFVCELHGYNVEGQHDIDELNKTGELDLTVRRLDASPAAKAKAKAETYGTIKMLVDTDGDGVMDKAVIWADHIPPCYGIIAANGGIIVACAPDILFLKDTHGDGQPDVSVKLFTGFATGMLERGINAPTWGPDNWIYFGRGWEGGTITGSNLAKPTIIGRTDFRIRPDGSAIEPVTGSTKTIGMAFTEAGDRFVATTTHPGVFVTPLPWRYLLRNPDAPTPVLDGPASDLTNTYPISPTHPWRLKRESHAEYFAFYRKISLSDAAANGYFTSACSPLVYRSSVLPGLKDDYLVCEPAQSLVHRAKIRRDGTRLRLERAPGEEKSEYLSSRDSWFHPVSLTHTPQGSLAIVDFYREIIEDYSAIPRHLQQQYGVLNGRERGRIWVLEAADAAKSDAPDLSAATNGELITALASPNYWLRRTAQHLLETRGRLPADFYLRGWVSSDDAQRALALRQADADHFRNHPEIEHELLRADPARFGPSLALQAALSLGESLSADRWKALAEIARAHGHLRWMDAAIATSATGHEGKLLATLAAQPAKSEAVMINLAGIIAGRGETMAIEASLAQLQTAGYQGKALTILQLGLEDTKPLPASTPQPTLTPPSADQLARWEKKVPDFVAALSNRPDLAAGRQLYQGICGGCHRSHGIGSVVGPDLDGEFQRAPETILRDILFPSEAMRPGYETLMVKTRRGETLHGIAASDSPSSLTLRLPGGTDRPFLRKRNSIQTLRNVSLMPAGFADALSPQQVADIIAFLRSIEGR